MSILLNPIIVGVVLLIVLCLLRINVLISLLLSALAAGLVAGMSVTDTMSTLIGGMGGNAQTALAYILLGTLAAAMAHTGITEILSKKLARVVGKKKMLLLVLLAVIACCSQNLIPVHIAFIPILVPALLPLMNDLKIDRRAAACSLAFGLKAPYISIPFGFGFVFQGIVAAEVTKNGMAIDVYDVWKTTWMIGASMILGLVAAWFVFRKPREYQNVAIAGSEDITEISEKLEMKHYVTLGAALITLVVNVMTESLPLGALAGVLFMVIFGAVKLSEFDQVINNGIGIMGLIAFIMLVASGYASVISETGAVDELVDASIGIMGNNKFIASAVMMLIGLIITMGIGTSFGTVPVLAVLYVPLCIKMGFSVEATVLLMAAAGALGDAGSPASDTTLGPTSGLNADGQHDHIWDTCVPTAICYNVPIALCAILLAPVI